MPTVAERNAGFDAAKLQITALEARVPYMFQGAVNQYLGADVILHMVDAVLTAAERARLAVPPALPVPGAFPPVATGVILPTGGGVGPVHMQLKKW